jgi:hypothetical protein
LEGRLKDKRYYQERAAYMRQLAQDALTDNLRKSCLRTAEEYERLAERVNEQSGKGIDQE